MEVSHAEFILKIVSACCCVVAIFFISRIIWQFNFYPFFVRLKIVKTRFKPGDILIKKGREAWENLEAEYDQVLEIGNRNYRHRHFFMIGNAQTSYDTASEFWYLEQGFKKKVIKPTTKLKVVEGVVEGQA